MENEIVAQQTNSPAEMIRMAVAGGADLDKLEKLLALQERWEAGEAKKAYHIAMAEFKANPPKIDKDKKVGYSTAKGKVGYSHASLANVVEKVTVELSKYGLSASWRTKQNGKIEVTCRITHVKGHSEETTLVADADDSGSKNKIQAIGSTISYLERYSLLAVLGLATYGQDDDARGVKEYINDEQVKTIREGLASLKADEAKFLAYMGVERLEDITVSDYQKATAAIEAKRGKK